MDAFDKLVAKHFPQAGPLQMLMEMVNQALTEAGEAEKKTAAEYGAMAGAPAYSQLQRGLPMGGMRGVALRPTEKSVGQKPYTEESQLFRLWMKHLEIDDGQGGDDRVANKIKHITNFLKNAEKELKGAPMEQILSYCMFLNTFAGMLTEFNASVAGFLWEPFLATLFGAESVQVATKEGDIADVHLKLVLNDKTAVSLKILNEAGDVKGSFSDLVEHFAKPENKGRPMKYVVIVKTMSPKKQQISDCTFYQFTIDRDTFFDWIGGWKKIDEPVLKPQPFNIARPTKDQEKLIAMLPASKPTRIVLRDQFVAGTRRGLAAAGTASKGGVTIAELVELEGEEGGEPTQHWFVAPAAEEWGLHDTSSNRPAKAEEEFFLDHNYTVSVVEKEAGGASAKQRVKTQVETLPFTAGTFTKKLWGDHLEFWQELAWELREQVGGDRAVTEFFQAVQGDWTESAKNIADTISIIKRDSDGSAIGRDLFDPEIITNTLKKGHPLLKSRKEAGAANPEQIRGALGVANREQFYITSAHYATKKGSLGVISITPHRIKEFFKHAAANIDENIVKMFEHLAELQDNIGRFFLTNCGGVDKSGQRIKKVCDEKDREVREKHGEAAMKNAFDLDNAVEEAVRGVTPGAEPAHHDEPDSEDPHRLFRK